MRVVINPGHFIGKDPGACGKFSNEAEIVKYVANVVCRDLEAAGFNPVLITSDSLKEICQLANEVNADLFVSIHCNAAANKAAKGTETFYYVGSSASKKLATCIQNELVKTMGSLDRGIKDGNWLYVLRGTSIPAVLTELGFISNADEEIYLNSHKQVMAHAISRAIIEYISK